MKKASSWLWGLVLVALGVILGVNALGLARIDIFFPGWWTLIIIIPCAIGVITDEHKGGELAGLIIGIFLLLGCLGVISFGMVWKLLLPVILIFIGIMVIARSMSNGAVQEKIRRVENERKAERRKQHRTIVEAEIVEEDGDGNVTKKKYSNQSEDSDNSKEDEDSDDDDSDDGENVEYKEYWSTFSEQDINYDGKEFTGCRLDAVFGGVDLDLRRAKIKNEAIVKASSIFGGVIIYVPENVKVEIASTAIFGGASDKRTAKNKSGDKTQKTLYIDATCVFGGVEIR